MSKKKKIIPIIICIVIAILIFSVIYIIIPKLRETSDSLSNLHYPKHSINQKEKSKIDEEILIEYSYSNYAWGYVYYGELITKKGNHYSFDCGDTYANGVVPNNCIIKKEKSISSKDLKKLLDLEDSIKEDIQVVNTANDFGEIIITYNTKDKEIILSGYGDNTYKNNSKGAKDALSILKKYKIYIK